MPVVTVLMPVFNGERYLDDAIASIRRQTFTDWELVIVDDGSTDATPRILREHEREDARIQVVRQENGGVVAALNRGLGVARGTYIARMDADDVAVPERLAHQVGVMRADPGIVACGSWYRLCGSRSGIVQVPTSDAECKALLLLRACFAHPTVIMRRDVVVEQSLMYRQEYQLAEDYDLWSRLAEFGRFANVPEPLLLYRVHKEQSSTAKRAQQQRVHARVSARNLARAGTRISEDELFLSSHPALGGVASPFTYIVHCAPVLARCIATAATERAFVARVCATMVLRNCVLILLHRVRGSRGRAAGRTP